VLSIAPQHLDFVVNCGEFRIVMQSEHSSVPNVVVVSSEEGDGLSSIV